MNPIINQYRELARYVCGFACGLINFLVVVGSGGLQKTWMVNQICPHARRLSGSMTAFQLYRELWNNRDHDFIIDDVDNLYADKAAIRLLKNLCDTGYTKSIQWNSAATALIREGIPTQFETRSRILIIANQWHTLNKNVGALEDRGIVLSFEPSAAEVHQQVGLWFKEDEIYGFVGDHLHQIHKPSMRTYLTARDLKSIGVDWRTELVKFWTSSATTANDTDTKSSLVPELLNALELHPEGMTKRQIFDYFHRNICAEVINAALRLLLTKGLVRMTVRSTGGRPAEVWQLIIHPVTSFPALPAATIIDAEAEPVAAP